MSRKRGKKYLEAIKNYQKDKFYEPEEALDLVKNLHWANFEESIDIAIKLGIDTRRSEEQVRGAADLPHGTGKKVKIVVFAEGEKAKEAEEAGADFVGAEDLAEKIQKGWTNFDATIATPDMMKIVGTVTFDIKNTVKAVKAGKVEYRADKFGIVHAPLGKTNFDKEKLLENFITFVGAIIKAKPSAVKGRYIRSIAVSSTMGPGAHIDPQKIDAWIEKQKI